MASKLIVTRQQLTSALHAAFEVFVGETSPVLDERMAMNGAVEPLPAASPRPLCRYCKVIKTRMVPRPCWSGSKALPRMAQPAHLQLEG